MGKKLLLVKNPRKPWYAWGSGSERELRERIKFYRTAAKQLESGLSGLGAVS